MQVKNGCTRCVVLFGDYAFKLPQFRYGWRNFLFGLLANQQENTWWNRTRNPFLCPVVFSIPGGWLTVQKKVIELQDDERTESQLKWYTESLYDLVEPKPSSFGWLDNKLVAIDYGGFGDARIPREEKTDS
jgi:hypothetical protein